jgi:predicted kinase
MKNKLLVLVGVPGSGKSTWISNQSWSAAWHIVSTDKHVDDYAVSVGKSYSEVFEEYMPIAIRLMADDVVKARAEYKNIVWDQTSVTRLSRMKKLRMLPAYEATAIVFPTPAEDELSRRLKSRPGKVIPQRVIIQMITGWEEPTLDEGFSKIVHVGDFNA